MTWMARRQIGDPLEAAWLPPSAGFPGAALRDSKAPCVERLEDRDCASGSDLAAEANVGGHGGSGVAELVCGGAGGRAGVVDGGGDGLPEDVGGQRPVR
jgi:hypothetical protein